MVVNIKNIFSFLKIRTKLENSNRFCKIKRPEGKTPSGRNRGRFAAAGLLTSAM